MIHQKLSCGLTDQLSFRIGSQIPAYQYLKGTQPSTSYTLSVSVFYNFQNDSGFIRF